MVDPFRLLAEARIQDWQRRRDAGEARSSPPADRGESLESHWLRRIFELIEQSASARGEEREQLKRDARDLEIRLMITLESSGLLLTSQRIAAEIVIAWQKAGMR